MGMEFANNNIIFENLFRYIGQTVTVFTQSGGLSGSGFTGVLLAIDNNCIRLLVSEGEAPCCPVGSACTGNWSPLGNVAANQGFIGNPLGAICVIPICAIVCFTHNAIG